MYVTFEHVLTFLMNGSTIFGFLLSTVSSLALNE